MGTIKFNGVPLYAGMQLVVAGKDIELESQVSATMVPRIIGTLPPDTPYEDEEFEYGGDIGGLESSSLPVKTTILSSKFKENAVAKNDSFAAPDQRKFVTPTNFYNKPQQPKIPKPLYVLHYSTCFSWCITVLVMILRAKRL